MKKIIALLFAILAFGIYAIKYTSNISLGDIIDSVGITDDETNNSGEINRFRGITTVVNGTTSSTDPEDGNVTIIDDVSDFALMNGSSGSFKLTKNTNTYFLTIKPPQYEKTHPDSFDSDWISCERRKIIRFHSRFDFQPDR